MQELLCVVDGKNLLGEGPVWDSRDRALYWSDIEAQTIYKLGAEREIRQWRMPERVGCLAPCGDGRAIVALHSRIVLFDFSDNSMRDVAAPERAKPLNRFNDGKCDRSGRFWAGTMDMNLAEPTGALYSVDADGTCRQQIADVGISNGLAFSPDNKTLYFADSLESKIFAFDFDMEAGEISNRRVFATVEGDGVIPDGATVDAEGYLWSAHWNGWRLVRYDPNGGIDCVVELPVQCPTCCTFGGDNLETLYVTSACGHLTDEELLRQPLAGGLFAFEPGVRGIADASYGG